MYFQGNGLWYRETGGTGSTIDILTGNNPHLGPYDKGSKYINQFKTLIPNFSAVTISSVTTTTDSTNLYTNYDLGTFDEGVSTATTVDTVSVYADDLDLSDCVVFEAKIEVDPNPTQVLNDCGCEVDTPDNVLSLCLSLNPNAVEPICDDNIVAVFQQESLGAFLIQQYQYNPDGSVYTDLNGSPSFTKTFFISTECCSSIGGLPFLIQEYEGSTLINTGYSCCYDGGKCGCKLTCNWSALPTALVLDGNPYIQFQTPQGQNRVVTPDGCHCVASLSAPTPNVTDPYTGQVGVGCQLTALGVTDIQSGSGSEILQYYQDRVNGVIPCV
jgi:hypothetical protein